MFFSKLFFENTFIILCSSFGLDEGKSVFVSLSKPLSWNLDLRKTLNDYSETYHGYVRYLVTIIAQQISGDMRNLFIILWWTENTQGKYLPVNFLII